jgi:DNA repair protein RecN (Recombination protein N)
MASQHLRVEKRVEGGRTRTRVEALAGERRVHEIADMIAGGKDQETARAEARRLMELKV